MMQELLSLVSFRHTRDCLSFIVTDKRCPSCSAAHREKGPLCPSCYAQIKQKSRRTCPHCGLPLEPAEDKDKICRQCPAPPFKFSRLYYYGPYSDLLRELILKWKFNDRLEIGPVFGKILEELCEELPREAGPQLIIPVPLHPSRLRLRGFNQSLILAEIISKTTGIPYTVKGLERVRRTAPQSTLSGSERRKNLLQAFTADKDMVTGKRILIVDDVFTTGSTMNECAEILLESGALRVEGMVLARALM